MDKVLRALRTWFRADARPLNRRRRRLTVEILEERLAPAGDFRSVIGLDAAQNLYPYRGTGYTVAVLDTGIDYRHPDLGGGFGNGRKVVAGWDFVNNDADPMDDNGHGTHLAGIVASGNAATPGVAPEANLVALKVLDANMNGSWTNIDSALQWVINHKTQYNIVAVNLSLGSGNYTSNPYALLDNDFSTLKNLGVFTAVAAGNRYYSFNSQQGLSYPSISPDVVSVGATWAANAGPITFSTGAAESSPVVDHIVSLTQRSSALSLVAPGAWITSTWLNGSTKPMGGTSMATAVVSGAAALLHQAYDQSGRGVQATQDNLLKVMQSTGIAIVDAEYGTDNVVNTGLAFKRLDLKAALDTVGLPNRAPTFGAIPNQTMSVGQTINVPMSARDADGDTIRFAYKQIFLPAQAYQLDRQFAFSYLGSYYVNSRGAGEKWVLGTGSLWYCILPNGELRRWAGSMSATMTAANLIGTLDATYHADPSKLWNAPYAGMPPAVFTLNGNILSVRSPAYWVGAYQVEVTASDGRYSVKRAFNITVTPPNVAPVLAAISNQSMAHALDFFTLPLSASDADKDPIAFSAQVQPIDGQAPPVSLSVQGNQLKIDPDARFVGTFTIQINASDGKASDVKTFTVTVNNTAPTLGPIVAQIMAKGQTIASVTLPVSDVDGDVLSIQAVTRIPDATAYQLNQQYGFQASSPTYYQNLCGYNEKWLIGKNNLWYVILPDGRIYRWTQSIGQTLQAGNLIATLDGKFFLEPRLLWNANPPAAPGLTFSFQGNTLTISRTATLTGVYFIDVTIGDGAATVTRTFQLTLN